MFAVTCDRFIVFIRWRGLLR